MKSYNLNIAGYNIGFEAASPATDLIPSARFQGSLIPDTGSDLLITVYSGVYNMTPAAERVFHAPFVEEVNGIQIRHKSNFWSIWKLESDLFIHTIFPLSSSDKSAVLKFSLTTKHWHLWVEGDDNVVDPLEYPLDGLILYYLTVIHGDILIHASGVNSAGRGYLFSGISGKGKTTMAGLWNNAGASVIHDDRLILRRSGDSITMYNTPVYDNDIPLSSPLHKIFLIEHAFENNIVPVKGATAISLIMANCIQHNWGAEIISRLLGSVSFLCGKIPVLKLSFVPNKSIIDHILENE